MVVGDAAALGNGRSGRRFRGTIYYVGAFAFPAKNASTQRVRSNAKIFRDLGFRVVLIGLHSGSGRGIERRGNFKRDGFHCLSLNTGQGRLRGAFRRLTAFSIMRIVRMRFERPAVICYNHLALSQAQIQIYCRLKHIPFSPDATEWYGPSGVFLADALRRVDTTIRMRILNRLADGIIATSRFLMRFYASTGKPLVELPTLFDRAETGVATTTADREHLQLVFSGNPFNPKLKRPNPVYWKERLDTIVDIVAEANRYEQCATLDVYGVSEEQYRVAFGITDPGPGPQWLKIWGMMPREHVLQATKDADFTIYFREPTRANKAGFPGKFGESLTCGTPVITNPMENTDPFAKDGLNCVLMDSTKPQQCAEQLRTLAGQRDRIAAMKQYCAATNPFDYWAWIEPVAAFVRRWLKEPEGPEVGPASR